MRQISTYSLIAAACCLTACIGAADGADPGEPIASVSLPSQGNNGLSAATVKEADLAQSPTIAQALVNNRLASPWVTTVSDELCSASDSAQSRELLKYIAYCALPGGPSVSFTCGATNYTYPGHYGLAPEWQTGACNSTCQAWVSACVIAHSNYQGADGVSLNITGPNIHLNNATNPSYPDDEGAYYGNIFASSTAPQRIYACQGADAANTYTTSIGQVIANMNRVCASFTSSGNCLYCPDANPFCSSGAMPYIGNLAVDSTVRNCTNLCDTKATAGGGYYSGCTATSGIYNAVITVWRH